MKQRSMATALLLGTAGTCLLDLLAQFLLAALAIRTPLPEKYLAAAQMLLCFAAVFAGARFAAHSSGLGSMTSSLIVSGCFALLIFILGFLLYHRAASAGEGIRFLLVVHIPFASCHLHGKILPLCR